MATTDELATFARERQEADRRYNEALTALDRAVGAIAARPTLDRDDVGRLSNALIVFLQQITAFVETKDREIEARAAARHGELRAIGAAIDELRSQTAILQRTVHALQRGATAGHQPPAPGAEPGATSARAATGPQPPAPDRDLLYVAFEDQFRGAPETIAERFRPYVPLFAGASDVLDVGCGRGEFLAALKAAGIRARGVDANGEMAALARERGLDAVHGDGLALLAQLPEGSLGGLFAAQVIEHLAPASLLRLVDLAHEKLRPGAPIVLETINPACWLAFFSSYVRDFTHVQPVHPDTLQFLLRANGFERVSVRYSEPVPEHVKMQPAHLPAAVLQSTDPEASALATLAHTINANAAILNNLLFTHYDYAAIGYRG
jgi:O-antigen chain-terminating methyltransferase